MSVRKVFESGTNGVGGGILLAATNFDLRWRCRTCWCCGFSKEGRRKDGNETALVCRMIILKI